MVQKLLVSCTPMGCLADLLGACTPLWSPLSCMMDSKLKGFQFKTK